MRDAFLPEERRIEPSPDGWRLRTSFIWFGHDPVQIPWAEVAGTVRIMGNAIVNAPKLRVVGSHVYVPRSSKIDFPQLREIIGDLYLYGPSDCNMSKLNHVGGNLRIAGQDLPSLETVGGLARFKWFRYLHLPSLRSVGGDMIDLDAEEISALKLLWVGGNFLAGDQILAVDVPELKTVMGPLFVQPAQSLKAGQLKSVGGNLYTWNAKNFYPDYIRVGGEWDINPEAEKMRIFRTRLIAIMKAEEPLIL